MKTIIVPSELKKMNNIFKNAGFKAYLVGGAVRDMLLGKTAHDFDVATDANPKQVMSIFNKVIPTGIQHGTVTVRFMHKSIEVTTFRTEADYSDGRHPNKVEYARTIQEDLSRRDFTMNAIAISLDDGKLVDPFNGQKDIKNKIIKSVGNAACRFKEDGLRPIRAIRFASQLNFSIEKDTYSHIFEDDVQNVVKKISIERFRDEFEKILACKKPSVALKLLEETGLLKIFIPELLDGKGCIQSDSRGFHEFDVLNHLFYSCDAASAENKIVRLASLFHDIGKPYVKKIILKDGSENITFYGHENEGSTLTKKILTRLKFPNVVIEKVSHLVLLHMFNYDSSWTNAAVRRFVIRVGKENISDLIDLRLADIGGMHNTPVRLHDSEIGKTLCALLERIDSVVTEEAALSLKDLAINGNDLINAGVPQGKMIGKILKELFDLITESPEMNTKETLLKVAKNIISSR